MRERGKKIDNLPNLWEKKYEREENHVTKSLYFGNDIVLTEEARIDKLKIGKSTKV